MNPIIRKHLHKPEPVELNITAFLNLMVILVPFLLITAVFTNLSVLQINLPTSAQQATSSKPEFELKIIIENHRLLVTDANGHIIKRIDKQGDKYDYRTLNRVLQELKYRFPDKTSATILSQAKTSYDTLIQVMDATRTFQSVDDGELIQLELFPDISIGDAYKS